MRNTSDISELQTVDTTLRGLAQRRSQLAHRLCHELIRFDDLGGPARLGFASLREYGEHALGLTAREVRECVRVGRRLVALPQVDAALEVGEVSWSAARALTRVAVPETETEWLKEAKTSSMRELEAAVSVSGAGDLPPDPDSRPVAQAITRFVFEVDSTDAQVVADALALRRSELGGDLDVADVFVDLCRSALAGASRSADGADSADAATTSIPAERFQIVLQKCPTCADVVHVGHGSAAHAVSPSVVAQAECDAAVVDMPRGGRATRTIPPAVRRRVLHRDGHRCAVPGCAARIWLAVHHLTPRAEGGRHDDDNLLILCPAHHARVHDGTLHLEAAPTGGFSVGRGASVPRADTLRPVRSPCTRAAPALPAVEAPLAAAIESCAAEFGWIVPQFVAARLSPATQADAVRDAIASVAAIRGWSPDDAGWYRCA